MSLLAAYPDRVSIRDGEREIHIWRGPRRASLVAVTIASFLELLRHGRPATFLAGVLLTLLAPSALSELSSIPTNTPRLHFGSAASDTASVSSRLSVADGSPLSAERMVEVSPGYSSAKAERGIPERPVTPAVFGTASSSGAARTTATDERPASAPSASPRMMVPPLRDDPALVVRAYSRSDVEAIIRNAFRERGLDADRAIAVAQCESSLDPTKIGDSGQSVGLWQFRLPTWSAAARRLFGRDVGDLRADPIVASMVAAAKIAYDGDWAAWSCAR